MSRAYYNENNKAAAHVLREIIAANVIAPGDVDERSIVDVQPGDLAGYTQCHFFAGGGLWSVAARLAGWPDDRPLWTGSCPCQPFSAAGNGRGTDDPRHLWPHLFRLIRAGRPAEVMGEQVAGAAGYGWLDGVRADLASEGFTSRTVDIPACAVDAPHQRNRLFWVAVDDSDHEQSSLRNAEQSGWATLESKRRDDRLLGNAGGAGRPVGPVADESFVQGQSPARQQSLAQSPTRSFRNGSFWSDYEWIVSPIDGKARRTKPGIPFLVDGFPGRVDLWRICGNAISPVLAAEVIAAFLETEGGLT